MYIVKVYKFRQEVKTKRVFNLLKQSNELQLFYSFYIVIYHYIVKDTIWYKTSLVEITRSPHCVARAIEKEKRKLLYILL